MKFILFVQISLLLILTAIRVDATATVGAWEPLFKGIDHSVGTNLPSPGGLPHRMVIHTLRVDLTDPDIQLRTTPRAQDYLPDAHETGGLTVSDFLVTNHLQVAINANRFEPGEYYLPAGTAMDISGLAIDQGIVVSEEETREDAATMLFNAKNQASIIYTNWPANPVGDAYTAISGTYPILINGNDISRNYVSLRDPLHDPNPRTLFGLSADRRYLYLMTIDGRQPGYSDGAYDYEAAEWLILVGAADGINVDGGGSTTLVIEDSTGFPLRLNQSSAVADSGHERTVGSHFGIVAKPLPGFINEVTVLPSDTSATIQWTTSEPSTSQVQYDTTTNLTQRTILDSNLLTEHSLVLPSLLPRTGYYFQILSATSEQQYTSRMFYFFTTNYVSTNVVFDVNQPWSFTESIPDGVDWTARTYNETNWSGPGPGLLWVDVRNGNPSPDVGPKNTRMPFDPSSGYPYPTYYLRTHFAISNLVANSSLAVNAFVDDGAVFYLNGTEIQRLRMTDGPVTFETLANGYPCDGDATCPDQFEVKGNALVQGDNVLAVEVHNYNARSADVTFGMSLSLIQPLARAANLAVSHKNNTLTLTWDATGFVLESASTIDGPWTPVAEATVSPYVTTTASSNRYFRLRDVNR